MALLYVIKHNNIYFLPGVQMGGMPNHLPLLRQALVSRPLRLNPSSQLYVAVESTSLLGTSTSPLIGAMRTGQRMAAVKNEEKFNSILSCSVLTYVGTQVLPRTMSHSPDRSFGGRR